MKFSTTAIVLFVSGFVAANPVPGGWHKEKWEKGEWKDELRGWGRKQTFTSTYAVIATPDQVMNGTVSAPGEPGAIGLYKFGINSQTDTICYDIILKGVTGPYQSLARTATHIHEARRGASGPPRIAFPNPQGNDNFKRSKGCMTGPFTTGINNTQTGLDTGTGFTLARIEADPAAFFCDAHTSRYVPGVVRGQLA